MFDTLRVLYTFACPPILIVIIGGAYIVFRYFSKRPLLMAIEAGEDPLTVDAQEMKQLVTGYRGANKRKGILYLMILLILGCMFTFGGVMLGPRVVSAFQPTATPTNTATATATNTPTPTNTPTATPDITLTPTLGIGTVIP